MNKAELIEAIAKTMGGQSSKAEIDRFLSAFITTAKASLKKEKRLQLVGFGTFKVVSRKARKGRNPKTGEQIKIKASKSVRFSPGKALKEAL